MCIKLVIRMRLLEKKIVKKMNACHRMKLCLICHTNEWFGAIKVNDVCLFSEMKRCPLCTGEEKFKLRFKHLTGMSYTHL